MSAGGLVPAGGGFGGGFGGGGGFQAGVNFMFANFTQVNIQQNQLIQNMGQLEQAAESTGATIAQTNRRSSSSFMELGAQMTIVFFELRRHGRMVQQIGIDIYRSYVGLASEIATLGAEFESARVRLRHVFGDAQIASEKFKAALSAAEETSLSTMETLKYLPQYWRQGVDLLEKYNFLAKDGAEVTSTGLQLVNDLITGSSQTSFEVFRNFNKAIAGNIRNFRALFDGVEERVSSTGETFTDLFKGAETAQDRSAVIFKTIIESGMGGMAEAAKGSFDFVVKNIHDTYTNFMGLVGLSNMAFLTPIAQQILNILKSFKENDDLINSVAGAVQMLATYVGLVVDRGLRMVAFFADLAASYPILSKIGVLMALVVPAFLIFSGTMLILAAFLGGLLAFALPGLIAGLKILAVVGWPVVVAMTAITVAVGIAYAAWRRNFGGLADFIAKVRLGLDGLIEVVQNYSRSTSRISNETHANLKKAGILEWVVSLGGWIGATLEHIGDMAGFVSRNWENVVASFAPITTALEQGFHRLWRVVKGVFHEFAGGVLMLDGSSRPMHDFIAGWHRMVNSIRISAGILAPYVERMFMLMEPILARTLVVFKNLMGFSPSNAFLLELLDGLMIMTTEWVATGVIGIFEGFLNVIGVAVLVLRSLWDIFSSVVGIFQDGESSVTSMQLAVSLLLTPLFFLGTWLRFIAGALNLVAYVMRGMFWIVTDLLAPAINSLADDFKYLIGESETLTGWLGDVKFLMNEIADLWTNSSIGEAWDLVFNKEEALGLASGQEEKKTPGAISTKSTAPQFGLTAGGAMPPQYPAPLAHKPGSPPKVIASDAEMHRLLNIQIRETRGLRKEIRDAGRLGSKGFGQVEETK